MWHWLKIDLNRRKFVAAFARELDAIMPRVDSRRHVYQRRD
jgi:hypothetical protein